MAEASAGIEEAVNTWAGIFYYLCCVTSVESKAAQNEIGEKRILAGRRYTEMKSENEEIWTI